MNPSGGLRWHWKAWRSQSLWEPTCQDIATWLAEKPAQRSELLLIGASAGWMMSSAWLAGFRKVTTYDIDPLAGPLFRWRHGKSLTVSGTELLCERGDALNQLGEVLQAHRQALVLFDNVLGQMWTRPATASPASGAACAAGTGVAFTTPTPARCARRYRAVPTRP